MSATSYSEQPLVLTTDGRRWLEERLRAARHRLARVVDDLASERTDELLQEQRQLREHIDQLTADLDRAVAPGDVRDDPAVIELGDEVEVRLPDDAVESFLVVHPLEAGMDEHRTSADSPLARAVIGHRVGDRVTVTSPGGVYGCTVVSRRRLQ